MSCLVVCNPPLIASGCPCLKTCTDSEKVCPTDCTPGCNCPDGYVFSNGSCITVQECPCYDSDTGDVMEVN